MQTRFGDSGRDSIRGPGQASADVSVFRNFHLYRETNFQFRAEAFDVTNTATFANPNSNSSGTNFGFITANSNFNRTIQFSGRFLV